MYHKILVPLDGSRESEMVIGLVRRELAPSGKFILLQVVPPAKNQKVGEHVIASTQQEEADRSAALHYLRSVAQQENTQPDDWLVEVPISNSVADEIVSVAHRDGADLVAMYTHDRRGMARLIRGSIADKVKGMSSVEVRTFPPQLVEAVKSYTGRPMAMTKTILVVDDDQDTVDLLQLYLAHEGYRSMAAYDGQEALKRVKEFDPDLIILDLMLPIVGGFQVCRHIRAESGVPIVILTARLDEESRRAGAEVGAQDYITKPFSPKELVARVKCVLERMNE